ncbi:MAG: YbaN family protein [Nitrococcus sp.]|nr:YbaN family protein [Nitrococcus sp.]
MDIWPREYTWKDITRISLGLVMLVLGVAGLIVPVLQGFLFLLIAVFLLAPYSGFMQRLLDMGERRFPGAAARARSAYNRWFRRQRDG